MTVFTHALNHVDLLLSNDHIANSGILEFVSLVSLPSDIPNAERNLRLVVVKTDGRSLILKATGRTGTTLTGVTAVENTTDIDIVIADSIRVQTTAGYFNDLADAINTLETSGGGGGGGDSGGIMLIDNTFTIQGADLAVAAQDLTSWLLVIADFTPTKVYLFSKSQPTTNLTVDILYRISGGSWTSLWSTNPKPILTAGANENTLSTFDVDMIPQGALLRIDLVNNGGIDIGQDLIVHLIGTI